MSYRITNNGKRLTNRNLGYGLNFNGSNNYVSLGNTSSLALQTNFSVYFVLNVFSINNIIFPIGTVVGRTKVGTDSREWLVQLVSAGGSNYYLSFQSTDNNATSFDTVFSPILNFNKIYYCFCIVNNLKQVRFIAYDTENLIFDTVSSSLPIYSYDNVNRETNVGVTRQLAGDSFRLNGILYDLKIFNTVLTQDNVTQLAKFNNYTTNMIYHLPFNSINGTTTPERVGGGIANLTGYNTGDKPLRDINGSIVNNYTI